MERKNCSWIVITYPFWVTLSVKHKLMLYSVSHKSRIIWKLCYLGKIQKNVKRGKCCWKSRFPSQVLEKILTSRYDATSTIVKNSGRFAMLTWQFPIIPVSFTTVFPCAGNTFPCHCHKPRPEGTKILTLWRQAASLKMNAGLALM